MPAFPLTILVTLVAYIAINGSRLAVVLAGLELGATPFQAGILSGLLWFFPLLISWPVGRFADRFGSRWMLLAGAVGGLVGMVLPFYIPGLPVLFAAAALTGLWNAFSHVTTQSLMQILSTPATLTRNFVWYSMVGSICNFSGPVLGGYAIQHMGAVWTFISLGVAAFICIVLLVLLGGVIPRGMAGASEEEARSAPAAVSALSMLATLKDSTVLRLIGVSAMVQLMLDLFPLYIPLHGRGIGLSSSTLGNLVGTVFAASFFVQLGLARVVGRFGERNVLTYTFIAAVCGFLLLPLTGSALTLGLVAVLFGTALGSGHPVTSMLLASRAPGGRLAESLGFRLSVTNVLRVIGPTILGSLGTLLGLVPMFAITAALMGGGGALSRRLPFRSHSTPH